MFNDPYSSKREAIIISELNLVRIGPDAYLSEGQSAEHPNGSSDPNLILIFGWMEARLPHIQKYANVYRQLYPAATQIIFRTPPSFFWSTTRRNRASLGSAADVISKLNASGARILVHSFSNGGASQMMNLAGILSNKLPAAQRLSVLILDSSPGTVQSLAHVVRVFTTQIRNPVLRIVVAILVGSSLIVSRVVNAVLRRRHFVDLLREWLLCPSLFPWMTKDTPRLYLYSKVDDMVSWEDVEEHAATAVNKGLNVSAECFKDTPHVAHARKYPDRYWAAVKKLWADAVKLNE